MDRRQQQLKALKTFKLQQLSYGSHVGLVDSGATNALRPIRQGEDCSTYPEVDVSLANGKSVKLKMSPGGSMLAPDMYIHTYIMKRSCQETSHRHLAQRSCQKTSYRDLCKESSYRDLVQRACQQTSYGDLVQRPVEESTSFARKSYIDSLNRDLILRFLTKNFCGDLL